VTALAFAVVVWWTSNTIAHHFIHRPFFRRRSANRLFAIGMSVTVGIPQTLWRDRHLAHHAGVAPRLRLSADLMLQAVLVLALWIVLLDRAPLFFATVYVPGYLGGLLLCAVHGHYEHAGGTISHYGRLYNLLLFNDGYHVEHHANPGLPWSRLPERRDPRARESAWPAPLRWLERLRNSELGIWNGRREFRILNSKFRILEALERLVLRSRALQRFVLRTHKRALGDLIVRLPSIRRIAIIGGGLFPRTAIILRSLVPDAEITIIDANRANLDRARKWIGSALFVHAHYRGSDLGSGLGSDLVVIPLAFDGDREAIYRHPPAPAVIVHDWIWRKRAVSRIVSLALLKRVNLVCR
jgi:Fatty acid desaturase